MFVRRVICLLVTLRTPRICSVFAAPSVTRGLVGELAIVSGAICFSPMPALFLSGILLKVLLSYCHCHTQLSLQIFILLKRFLFFFLLFFFLLFLLFFCLIFLRLGTFYLLRILVFDHVVLQAFCLCRLFSILHNFCQSNWTFSDLCLCLSFDVFESC